MRVENLALPGPTEEEIGAPVIRWSAVMTMYPRKKIAMTP